MRIPDDDLKPVAVSPDTCARLLEIGRTTVYAHMSAGNLRFVTVGPARRIPMTEIDRVLREGLPKLPPRASK